jgi:hypothetical protein
MSEEKIPKFRSANRLVLWVRHKSLRDRLPAEREKVFFECHEKNPIEAASQLAKYASFVGKLDAPLENLFLSEQKSLLHYIKIVHNLGQEVNQDLVRALKGSSSFIFSWAHHTKMRLDEDLENALDDGTRSCPRWCYRYAKEVLKGKLPEHLEEVFSKYDDSYHASKYAFDVIRGFAPCRLSDNLHTYMVMKSFQNTNVEHIKVYMEASESNPSLVGNSSARVT